MSKATPDLSSVIELKFPEPELRQLTKEDVDDLVSVIVEPDLPPQKLVVNKKSNRTTQSHFLMEVAEETPARQRQNLLKVKKTSDYLQSLIGETPHWLNSARAFVVTATPAQLREIALSPLIKAVRLNRRLKKTG